jgi:hypothetical protein
MFLKDLIELAKEKAGSYGALASMLDCHQNRITDWKNGTRKPDAGKIACMAACAGLPVLETVADIESQLDEINSHVWRSALGRLRAAGVTAAAAGMAAGMAGAPEDSHAKRDTYHSSQNGALYIMLTKRYDRQT